MPALRRASAEAGDVHIRETAAELVRRHSVGALLWTYECPHGGDLLQPLRWVGWGEGIFIVECGCSGAPLVGLAEATGEVRWEAKPGAGFATHAVLFADDGLIVATVNTGPDRLIAVDVSSGAERWTVIGRKGLHRAVLAGGRAYVGGGDGLRAVDVKDGRVLWHFETETWVSTPTLTERFALASGSDGRIRAVDLETGASAWEFPVKGKASPVGVAGDVALFAGEEKLHAVRIDTGELVWECAVKGWSHDAPYAVEGTAYYTTLYPGPELETGGYSQLSRHYAIDLATGDVRRDQADPIQIGEPRRPIEKKVRIGDDDVILELTEDGRVAGAHGTRVVVALRGFPVLSGERYEGPRHSVVACLRAVDVDR